MFIINPHYYAIAEKVSSIVGYPIHPDWIYAQMAHETNNFTSDLCVDYHNLAGVTQFLENDTPQPDGDFYYKQFSSDDEFAQYFGHYLCLYASDGIYDVTSMYEYVCALKRGCYFGDTVKNYYGGMLNYVEK